MKKPRIALVHEYLVQYGGAEKTLEAILEVFPESPIYTGLYNPEKLSKFLNDQKIISHKNKLLSKFQKFLTFLMPLVFESFDLRDYDIIISDGTAWPKGVLTTPDQLHVSYIHTPPRFLYGYSVESQKRDVWYFKPFVMVIDFGLRIWDYYAAQRPNVLLTNSLETQKRIRKFYGREAQVIYPPVETNYETDRKEKVEYTDYYVALGRLSAYKNFDFLVKAFNECGKTLVVVGTGGEESRLKMLAKDNIKFEGQVSEKRKSTLLENCLGVINSVQDEDLGIVPIEAMAHGKPVLAHKSGGHLETITEGVSGLFFDNFEQTDFTEKLREFEMMINTGKFEALRIKESVKKFDKERFKQELKQVIDKEWEAFNAGTTRSTHNNHRS